MYEQALLLGVILSRIFSPPLLLSAEEHQAMEFAMPRPAAVVIRVALDDASFRGARPDPPHTSS